MVPLCLLQNCSLSSPSCCNGLSCNVEYTSSSTDISAFKRMLRGDDTKRLSAAFHHLAALCNQATSCFASPSRHVCYLSLFLFTPFFGKNQVKFIYNLKKIIVFPAARKQQHWRRQHSENLLRVPWGYARYSRSLQL